jgi:hypothetical protein
MENIPVSLPAINKEVLETPGIHKVLPTASTTTGVSNRRSTDIFFSEKIFFNFFDP